MGFLGSALPLIGTAIGTYFGMPSVGAAIGGALGGAVNGSGSGSGSPAGTADPFAQYRGQFATQLTDFMKTQPYGEASSAMRTMAMSGSPVTNLKTMEQIASQRESPADAALDQMITPGATFNPLDPSYNFRVQQGQQALERSAAAKGMTGSGNVATALVDYGQQAGSQEYAAQFGRLSSLSQLRSAQAQQQFGQLGSISGLQLAADQTKFGELSTVDTAAQNEYQQQYSRLAQLSGAVTGSPSQAGSLLQQQQAGSAAFMQTAGKEVSSLFGGMFSSLFGGGGGSSSAASAAPSWADWGWKG